MGVLFSREACVQDALTEFRHQIMSIGHEVEADIHRRGFSQSGGSVHLNKVVPALRAVEDRIVECDEAAAERQLALCRESHSVPRGLSPFSPEQAASLGKVIVNAATEIPSLLAQIAPAFRQPDPAGGFGGHAGRAQVRIVREYLARDHEFKQMIDAIVGHALFANAVPQPKAMLPSRIWTVEEYYQAKDFYEQHGLVFNPALQADSPAAYHVAAQASLQSSKEAQSPMPRMPCPTCGKPAPVIDGNVLWCDDCRNYDGTYYGLFVDLQTEGKLLTGGDETLAKLRHLCRMRFGGFSADTLNPLLDWLIAEQGLSREQVMVCKLARIVELLVGPTGAELIQKNEPFPASIELSQAGILDPVTLGDLQSVNPQLAKKTIQNRISALKNGPKAFPLPDQSAPGRESVWSYSKLLPAIIENWSYLIWPSSYQELREIIERSTEQGST